MSDEPDTPEDRPDDAPKPSAVDPTRDRKIRNRQKREEAERAEFWRGIFSSEIGRREMWLLLARLHPFSARMGTTPVGFSDERTTWMYLAEQLVGQHIFQEWFGMHADLVLLMRQENDPAFRKARE